MVSIILKNLRKKISESHKGKEPYNKGKSMSEEQKKKLSELRKGKYCDKNSPRSRKIIRLSDSNVYGYMGEAARENNMCIDTMRNRCKAHKDFMYYDEYLLTQQND